jgi:phage shock protein A
MGIFTRFKDIINANVNSILDRAEDPEKTVKLVIREMEDTLIEMKSSTTNARSSKKRMAGSLSQLEETAIVWEERAKQAIERNRDDLAREALANKTQCLAGLESIKLKIQEQETLLIKLEGDIIHLESKLDHARDQQSNLIKRHQHAQKNKKIQSDLRRLERGGGIFDRFDEMENRIEKMEAESDLEQWHTRIDPTKAFDSDQDRRQQDEQIEKKLQALKNDISK